MEKERKINWLGLFIKIIIIFIFVLIIIWLISKITLKTRLSDTFKSNINNMETVATNYFKSIDLPLEKGKSKKITLGEMIDKGLIVTAEDKKDSSCDTKNSFSKITRKKNNYVLDTTLKCGEEKSTISKNFSLKDCKNCSNKTNENIENKENNENKEKNNNKANENIENKENKGNNNNDKTPTSTDNNNNNITDNNVSYGVTYYEYVKETTTYSKWMQGPVTGNNVENKYEYYGIAKDTYYTVGVINDYNFIEGNTINYTLKLNRVPRKDYYFSRVEEQSYYTIHDESKYVYEKDVTVNNYELINPKKINNHSLTSKNFIYKLSPYYRKGIFYIDVEIKITGISEITPYTYGNEKIYFVPLKLNIVFASDNVTSTQPEGDYETISYYRYVTKNRDVIWSPESYIEGYTKTGKSEVRESVK